MHDSAAIADDTAPIGPAAISTFLVLLAISPLMRGGNRQVALIVLESVALAFLLAVWLRADRFSAQPFARRMLLALVVFSPLWLALVYLLPLPGAVWNALPGRSLYSGLLQSAGISQQEWLPSSLVPDATAVSLFAGIPLIAAFIAGYGSSLKQLKRIVMVLVLVAMAEVVVGLLQAAGGRDSVLYFGAYRARPFGTFANPNHFANYISLALAAYVWLGWVKLTESRRSVRGGTDRGLEGRLKVLWGAGAVLLIIGVLMSRSRGAALAGLPAALAAFVLVLTLGSRFRSWRLIVLATCGALAAGIALVGFDALITRFDLQRISADVPLRTIQAASTLDGAIQFWPWGAGWGTYSDVYPRFQPAPLIGTAYHAHHDYAEMLFEGGIFAVLLLAAFASLAIGRATTLVRSALQKRRLKGEEMAAAVCGLGLLGFLLHSFAEFNMHIPANAIAAALLAGAYLRPLEERTDD